MRLTPGWACLFSLLAATAWAADGAARAAQLENAAAFVKVTGVGEDNKPRAWTGSGICILPGGWLVTNRHVAPGDSRTANTIRVIFSAGTADEMSGPAEVVLTHADRDLALLKCRLKTPPTAVDMRSGFDRKLADPVTCIGFPLGDQIAVPGASLSVSVVPGNVSALRRDASGRLWWVDAAAAVAGGNSGSGLLDADGRLVGIVAQRYEGFARAIPIEFVHELLGEAALDVTVSPEVVGEEASDVAITVDTGGPATAVEQIVVSEFAQDGAMTKLNRETAERFVGKLRLRPSESAAKAAMVKVQAVRESGVAFERLIAVRRKADAAVPLRLTLHSVLLKDTKPDGAKWDFGPPDPQCRIYINDILVKETVVAQDQFRFLKATEIDCEENDKVRIVVHDRDINFHDHAGDIEFVAKSGLTITKPSRGQIENCDITVRAIPVRLAIRR